MPDLHRPWEASALGFQESSLVPHQRVFKCTPRMLGQEFRYRTIWGSYCLVPGLTKVFKADPPHFRGENPKPN
eukprot:5028332-Prymnesium_polylepis.1